MLRDINKTLPKTDRIQEIKSFYGDEFSEKVLCYNVIESIYPEACVRFSGKDLDQMKIPGAPDYYLRCGKQILIFESKDFLIAADKKMSFDASVYEAEFGRVLDYEELPNGDIKPKAVMQLIGNIRKLLRNQFIADTNYHYRNAEIFPILLTHDHQYDTPGFNELINFWFQDALLELQAEGLYIQKVRPLSVVSIDSLIFNQVGLSHYAPLHKVLNQYLKNKDVFEEKKRKFRSHQEYERYLAWYEEMRIAKLMPFSLFIDNFFSNAGWKKTPPLVQSIAPSLFGKNVNT